LREQEFDFSVSHKNIDGRLFFGGSKGYTTFNPIELSPVESKIKLSFTSVEIGKKPKLSQRRLRNLNSIVLTKDNHFITFHFSVLDFIDPENNKFRHKLVNFDPDWIDIGTRKSATYTNLPPGQYVFRVQGSNSAGVWNRDGISVQLIVLPPPWRTWWAYTGYAIFAILFFWLAFRTYHSYVLRRAQEKLEIRMHDDAERAYEELHEQFELHDNLARAAHSHTQDTLNLIRSFLSSQRDFSSGLSASDSFDKSESLVSALATLEGCLHYSNDRLTADLHQFTELRIAVLLESSNIDAERLISINEVPEHGVPAETATPLAIFINEAIENALQHAFLETDPVCYIQVSLEINSTADYLLNTEYHLSVSDSGVGIPESIKPGKFETLGFSIMHAMAEKLSGELDFPAGEGTRITLKFRTAA
jgi:two-component sensor histidine kinase